MRRPSPALVISILALIVSLGGTGYAAFELPAGSVGTKQLKARAVTTAKIRDGAVTARKINTKGLTVPDARTLQGHHATDFATVASEAWHEVGKAGQPQFQNGYTNFGNGFSTAAFYKDSMGIVHLKGTLLQPPGLGTNAPTAFTLPPGYRPAQNLFAPEASGGPTKELYIKTDGEVQPRDTMGDAGLDGITFRAS